MKRLVSYAIVASILGGCGQLGGTPTPYPLDTPFDGVKLVSTSITDAQDPRTMTQETYAISSTSRLLIRLEDFLQKMDSVSLANNAPVSVILTLDQASGAALAQANFQVCPLLKNWMMLATWRRAYPMGSDGNWSQAGGDYEPSACISVKSVTGTDVTFDVTPWFVNYIKGRSLNYGLVLISNTATSITIKGDQDAYHAPRMEWNQIQ